VRFFKNSTDLDKKNCYGLTLLKIVITGYFRETIDAINHFVPAEELPAFYNVE